MKNFIVRYGIIASIILVALGLVNWFLVAQTAGYMASNIMGYLSMVIALLTIPVAIKYFRDKLNHQVVSFGQGFKIGFGITLICSIVMGLYSALFFAVAGDQFMDWYKRNVTPEEWVEIEAQIAAMPEFVYQPWFQGIIMLITVLIIGLLMSVLFAVILKRNN